MKNKLIVIGGASGVGKNTLVNFLKDTIPMYYYKRRDAFFDFAIQNKITKDEVFEKVSAYEADHFFISKCMKHNISITDLHYAVQVNRDRHFYKDDYYSMNIDEIYVDVIQDHFYNMISNMDVMFVLLEADIKTIIYRNLVREKETKRKGRCISYEDVKMQISHEKLSWTNIKECYGVTKLLIDANDLDKEFIIDKVCEFINS